MTNEEINCPAGDNAGAAKKTATGHISPKVSPEAADMVVTSIHMEIVKNLGNYQSVRLAADYAVNVGDEQNLTGLFFSAKTALEAAYNRLYTNGNG